MLKTDSLLERFRRLDFVTGKKKVVQKPLVPEDHIAEQLEYVQEIGKTRLYKDGLHPVLLRRLEELDSMISMSIESHAKLAELEGRKMEVRGILELFHERNEET